jgi:hypothetical protein
MHTPHFKAVNLRAEDHIVSLGAHQDGRARMNHANFPPYDIAASGMDTIFEIPNPFPFRGVTYICKSWGDAKAADPSTIGLPKPHPTSLHTSLKSIYPEGEDRKPTAAAMIKGLPLTLQLALAATSTDPNDLILLARESCRLNFDADGRPTGMQFEQDRNGRCRPHIVNPELFEVVINNPYLPDDYKEAMVLRPGIQGDSAIIGDQRSGHSHVYEYLRQNSYIPWGHYAANMAHDAVRYVMDDITLEDITAMRHLYYQRTLVRLAQDMAISVDVSRQALSGEELEALRQRIVKKLSTRRNAPPLTFNATLWGWNYGFDYAASGYRLHASHQQIHQQYAMVPGQTSFGDPDRTLEGPSYACGDLIEDFIENYRHHTGSDFFNCYEKAIHSNQRLDGRTDRPADLVVFGDENVMLFVPKAQTSQWELQMMTTRPVGNVLEADTPTRRSLDRGLWIAMKVLTTMGARMISVIEFSKRLDAGNTGQRLIYDFLPKIPCSPGAFSEAQLRWINGHYPEDFAMACRLQVQALGPDA